MLRAAYAAGRLGRPELDERTVTALSASTRGQMRDLTEDVRALPAGSQPAASGPLGLVRGRASGERGHVPGGLVSALADGRAAVKAWPAAFLVPPAILFLERRWRM